VFLESRHCTVASYPNTFFIFQISAVFPMGFPRYLEDEEGIGVGIVGIVYGKLV